MGRLAVVLAQDGVLQEAKHLLQAGEPLVLEQTSEYAKFLCNKGQVEVLANEPVLATESLTKAQGLAQQLQVVEESKLMQDILQLQHMLNES